MRIKLITEVGIRGRLRIYWERVRVVAMEPCGVASCETKQHPKYEYLGGCPNSYGLGGDGIHNAYTPLGDVLGFRDVIDGEATFGALDTHPPERWPTACEHCKAPVPSDWGEPEAAGSIGIRLTRQVWGERLYDSPTGRAELGDAYYSSHTQADDCIFWSNCDGRHLHVVLPNGHHWDVDSRARNCDMPNDRVHRCWVKSGSIEGGDLTVGKGGITCTAGAGSIQAGDWHGFLTNMNLQLHR